MTNSQQLGSDARLTSAEFDWIREEWTHEQIMDMIVGGGKYVHPDKVPVSGCFVWALVCLFVWVCCVWGGGGGGGGGYVGRRRHLTLRVVQGYAGKGAMRSWIRWMLLVSAGAHLCTSFS